MEDPRIRKFAKFLINHAVYLQKDEKILLELHGKQTGLLKALVEEAYAAGGKPFVHIFDYEVEGALKLCIRDRSKGICSEPGSYQSVYALRSQVQVYQKGEKHGSS